MSTENHMNIPQIFFSKAKELHSKEALLYKDIEKESWQSVNWDEFQERVEALASYLLSIGISKGDCVALLSENRPEWAISDLAILSIGAITVPIYFTNTSSQADYILKDSRSTVVMVSDKSQLDKILQHESKKNLKKIITFDKISSDDENIIHLPEINKVDLSKEKAKIKLILKSLNGEDVASILYTSGTTGPPKGVVLTHNNFISNAKAIKASVQVDGKDLFLSFLPLSHAFERTVGYYVPLFSGSKIAYAECVEKIPLNMREVCPTIIVGVPRFYEKTYAAIIEAVGKGSFIKKALFSWAMNVGKELMKMRELERKPSGGLTVQKNIADALVLKKVKGRLGGRLRFFVSGGAPLSSTIQQFFESLGVIILEGYGLTETSPVITCNTLKERKTGSVGKALPGVEIDIAPDGEIIAKGPNLMKGYFGQNDASSEVIKDGWFYTGDIGKIDDDLFLAITDRKKDIIITSGGKNVAPQNIETALLSDPLISQIMVYGDGKKYLTALIVPDMLALEKVASSQEIGYSSLEELIENREVHEIFKKKIEEKLKDFARYEKIKKFSLLANELTIDAGEITPTLKIKRTFVTKRYQHLLDRLYNN